MLDRAYTGLVFGLDARIHVLVEPLEGAVGVVDEIIVRSPQFKDTEWRYGYRVMEESAGVEVVQLKGWVKSLLILHSSSYVSNASLLAPELSHKQWVASTSRLKPISPVFLNFSRASN